MTTYHLRVKNATKPGGGKVSAKRHADYINREGTQSDRNDCVFKDS